MVLVGCVVGAGVLFYTTTGSSAARPTATPSPTAAAHETPEIAHSGKTPKPVDHETTPTVAASPTQVRLTLAQVRSLPRPFVPPAATGGSFQPPAAPAATEPPAAAETPTPAQTTPTPGTPPSEDPPATATQPPQVPTATPTAPFPWWDIPTPPPLPPHPDAGVAPNPPSE